MLKPLRVIGVSSLLALGGLWPSPSSAADFSPGDPILVQVEAGGKDRYKGEVTEVIQGPDGTVYYAVKWDAGSGYQASNTGRFPASRLTARDGAPRAPRPAQPVANPPRNDGAPSPASRPPQNSGGAPSAPAAPASPAAQGSYRPGDAVRVTMPDGKESFKGVVDEVIANPDGSTAYAVRWDTGNGFTPNNSGRFPASRLSPLEGAPRPGPAPVPPGSQPLPPVRVAGPDPAPVRPPAPTPPANPADTAPPAPRPAAPPGEPPADTNPAVTADDLEWFYGEWRTVLWGNSNVFEKGEQLWKQTLTYTTPGATLTITKDGYSWANRDGAVVKGFWRKLTAKEDLIAGGKSGLMLLKGPDGKDWRVDYNVTQGKGNDGIRIWNAADFWGERVGGNKPQPAWAKVQFAQNDAVTVDAPSGPCPGVILNVREPDSRGIVYYEVRFTESDGRVTTGLFQAIRIHKK